MSPSATVLGLFIGWTLLLVVVMEVARCYFLLKGRLRATELKPDNSNLPPVMQRLARAHANCVESFPVFGGLLVLALVTDNTAITDPLAPWFLLARVAQSSIHVASLGMLAVNARFAAFVVQVVIAISWAWGMLAPAAAPTATDASGAVRKCEAVAQRTLSTGYAMGSASATNGPGPGEVIVQGLMTSEDPALPPRTWQCLMKDGAIRRIEVAPATGAGTR